MFLHMSVILFTRGVEYQGRYTPRHLHHPQGRYTPGRYTPSGRYTPPGRYTSPRQVHPFPGRYTPQAGTPPLPGKVHLPGRYTPQQCMLGYGQQAGGTHSTGMHSCYTFYFAGGLVGVAVREYSEDHPSLDNAKPGIL